MSLREKFRGCRYRLREELGWRAMESRTTDAGPLFGWQHEDELGIDANINIRLTPRPHAAPLKEILEEARDHCVNALDLLGSKTATDCSEEVEKHIAKTYGLLHGDSRIRKRNAQLRDMSDELDKYRTELLVKFHYWWPPCAMFVLCFALQSVLLHKATFYYIEYMDAFESVITSANSNQSLQSPGPSTERIAMIKDGRLLDIVEDALGPKWDVPLLLLDLTGIVPMLAFAGSYSVLAFLGEDNVGLWTKTFLVGSIMAIIKGAFDVMTILPDSSGYANCKARLGEVGIAEIRRHAFFTGLTGLVRLARAEIFGLEPNGKTLRYCADMLTSGHTYFAVLFSLSAYKMLVYQAQSKRRQLLRTWVRRVCVACVVLEVILVTLSKFHYTVDMISSIILVCLLWDSIYVETVASNWVEGYEWRDPNWRWPGLRVMLGLEKRPELSEATVCTSRSRKLVNLGTLRGLIVDDPDAEGDVELPARIRQISDPSHGSVLLVQIRSARQLHNAGQHAAYAEVSLNGRKYGRTTEVSGLSHLKPVWDHTQLIQVPTYGSSSVDVLLEVWGTYRFKAAHKKLGQAEVKVDLDILSQSGEWESRSKSLVPSRGQISFKIKMKKESPHMTTRDCKLNGRYVDNWGQRLDLEQDGCSVRFSYKGKLQRATLNGNTLTIPNWETNFERNGTVEYDGNVYFTDGGTWARWADAA